MFTYQISGKFHKLSHKSRTDFNNSVDDTKKEITSHSERSSLICNRSARHERHEGDTSETRTTRVRHKCDTSTTLTRSVQHECDTIDISATQVKNF